MEQVVVEEARQKFKKVTDSFLEFMNKHNNMTQPLKEGESFSAPPEPTILSFIGKAKPELPPDVPNIIYTDQIRKELGQAEVLLEEEFYSPESIIPHIRKALKLLNDIK